MAAATADSSGAAVLRSRRPFSARFAVCLAILVVSALGLQSALSLLNYHTRKEPVALKKPLKLADWERMAPRYGLADIQPREPSEETINSLGTREFFNWRLIDKTLKPDDPAAVADVFVSYYTGSPDLVPHVPTECMVAGGYDLVRDEDAAPLTVPHSGAPGDRVAVHLSVFEAPRVNNPLNEGSRSGVTVAYFFHSNGAYCSSKYQVRAHLLNLLERYAYFAKVEVRFSSADFQSYADREQTLAALPPLLERLMPLLLQDHFRWDELHPPKSGG